MGKNGDAAADAALVKTCDGKALNDKTNFDKADKPNFDQYITGKPEKPLDQIAKCLSIHDLEPKVSDEDRKKAGEDVDKKASGLISEADRAALKGITDGVLSGDVDKFGKAIADAGKDPEKLKALVEEANKNLKEAGSSTTLSVNSEGKVIVHSPDSDKAVEVDPKTGKSRVVKVENDSDGGFLVKAGEYIGKSAKDVFKEMGDDAVNGVLGRKISLNIDPIWKGFPIEPKPLFPDEPRWPREHRDPIEWPAKPFQFKHEDPIRLLNSKDGRGLEIRRGNEN